MNLTERDRRLLLDIQDYGLLTTTRICARNFSGIARTTVLRRLRQLENGAYVKRTDILSDGGFAWYLTEFASAQLNGKPAKLHYPRSILEHDLALVDLRLKLEEAGIAQAWKSEHQMRVQLSQSLGHRHFATMHVPDGIMAISKGGHEAVAVEVELTAKSQSRYRQTFANYARKEELWALWYVVQTPSIGKQLLREAERNLGHRGTFFCWSLIEDVMKNPMQARIFALTDTCIVGKVFTAHGAAHPVSTCLST
jgi:hypothetical protein